MQRKGARSAEGRVRTQEAADHGVMVLAAAALAMAAACAAGDPTSSRSSFELVVERIEAPASGSTGHAHRAFVESDVVAAGRVVQDTVRATLRLVPRDPAFLPGPAAPGAAVFAAVDRYRVRYVRSDGRNVPGIDVPHPWDGALTLLVSFEGATGDFVLVRASAKLEPPLVRLRGGGGDVVINALAYVTFYGRDHAGSRIEATGAITIEFADRADSGPVQ